MANINTIVAVTNPTVIDDNTKGYIVGQKWLNTVNNAEYVCNDITTDNAVWEKVVKVEYVDYNNALYKNSKYEDRKFVTDSVINDEFPAIDIYELTQATIDEFTHVGLGAIPNYNPITGIISIIYRVGADAIGSVASKFYIATSDDGGQTWNAGYALTGVTFNPLYDYRNPQVICTSTGRLILFYDLYYSSEHHMPYFIYSDDDGDTWSAEDSYTNAAYDWIGLSLNNSFVETSDSTLYVPSYAINSTNGTRFIILLKSIDNGVTWSHVEGLETGGTWVTESTIVKITDRIFIMLMRGTNNIYQYITYDSGANWEYQGNCTFDSNTDGASGYQMLPKLSAINIFGVKVIACYWTNREDKQIKRILAIPKDLLGSTGHLGWKIDTLSIVHEFTAIADHGNGAPLHPNGNFRGFFVCDTSVDAATSSLTVFNTPNDIDVVANKLSISVIYDNIRGTNAPNCVPYYKGQTYIDTTNKKTYQSVDNSGLLDWYSMPLATPDEFKNYRDVIPQGSSSSKELGEPSSITLITTATDEMPTTEFEDCSQIFSPRVIEVGDYYFMYYTGNTQKFKTDETDDSTTQILSDFGRIDRVFLAYRRIDEGIKGTWQKWEDGRTPVLDIGAFDNVTKDGGNAWLTNVIYDGTEYVMSYTGDSQRSNTSHNFNPALATSTDGINWTKKGFITGLVGTPYRAYIVHNDSTYYLYVHNAVTVRLYSTTTPYVLDSWTELNSNIASSLAGSYTKVYNAQIFDGTVYLGLTTTTPTEVFLVSVPVASIETSAAYVDHGSLLLGSPLFGESYNGDADSPATVNYHSIVRSNDNTWEIFYNYYKNRMARYPHVPETGIRSKTLKNLMSLSVATPVQPNPIIPPSIEESLLVYYEMVQDTGTVEDLSGNGYTGVITGTPTTTTNGLDFGNAEVRTYVTMPAITADFKTIVMKFTPTEAIDVGARANVLFVKTATPTPKLSYADSISSYISDEHLGIANHPYYTVVKETYAAETPIILVYRWDGVSEYDVFINGVSLTTYDDAGSGHQPLINNIGFELGGKSSDTACQTLYGSYDFFKIYSDSMTDEDIAAITY